MATRNPSNRPRGDIPNVPKKSLFDEDSGDEDEASGDATNRSNDLTINQDFAKRFEHNKKREELHRLEEKYKSAKSSGAAEDDEGADEDSSDETEDEDAFLVTDELDGEIAATLQAIKKKDPRIYDKNTVFYKPFDTEAGSADVVKKEKPVFLRDYHRERYMRGDVGEDAEEKEEQDRTYAQEQDDLKQEILSQIRKTEAGQDSEDDDEDEAFVRRKETAVKAGNGVHPSRAAAIKLTELDVAKADENPEEYLSKFLESKAWRAEDGPEWQAFESDEEEDGDGNDLAEQFEHAYNMRFEDPEKSNEVLKSYSRDVVAARSLRREEPKGRKKQRQLEKEKKEIEKKDRDEERARLRRLKVEQASEKLRKIKQAAGMSGKALKEEEWMKFLDDAWEDDKWEEEMKHRFGEEYYAEADDLATSDDDGDEGDNENSSKKRRKKPKKPKWDDDIDIKDIVPDFDDETRPNITLTDSEQEDEGTGQPQRKRKAVEADEADVVNSDRPAKKNKSAKERRKERAEATKTARQELSKIEALVDVRMNLDDPTALTGAASSSKSNRDAAAAPLFRYRETSPNTFGMTVRDILLAPSDASLNQFAGLKKLAAFRDADKKRRDKKQLGKKARLREWRRETFGPQFEHTGPTYGFAGATERREDEPPPDSRLLEAPPAVDATAEDNVAEREGRKKRKKKLKRNRTKGKKAITASAEE